MFNPIYATRSDPFALMRSMLRDFDRLAPARPAHERRNPELTLRLASVLQAAS